MTASRNYVNPKIEMVCYLGIPTANSIKKGIMPVIGLRKPDDRSSGISLRLAVTTVTKIKSKRSRTFLLTRIRLANKNNPAGGL
jgi:hypothetical protein